MSGVSTLQTAGGLDVNELSKKLSNIPTLHEERETEGSEASSTAAIFGSDAGGQRSCVSLWLALRISG